MMAVETNGESIRRGLLVSFGVVLVGTTVASTSPGVWLLLGAGFLSAFFAGWVALSDRSGETARGALLAGAHRGAVVSGLVGLVVYLTLVTRLAGAIPAKSAIVGTGAQLFLVASPFAIVLFSALGLFGGSFGSVSKLLYRRR